MVRVGHKPVLSHIIENYPDAKFVITLGYKGELVRQFVDICYPDLDVEFVNVENYAGPGSSLLNSMYAAKDCLQCPFIFQNCDTVTKLPVVWLHQFNWIGGCQTRNSHDYRTIKVRGDEVIGINDKGALEYDYGLIGLNGIYDYYAFWTIAEELLKSKSESLSDAEVFTEMLKHRTIKFKYFPDWVDTGNPVALQEARERIDPDFVNLDKVDQSIYVYDDHVIKVFAQDNIVPHLVCRAKSLAPHTPEILEHSDNFIKYRKIDGTLLRDCMQPHNIPRFFHWCQKCLWEDDKPVDINDLCLRFYYTKVISRLQSFYKQNNFQDGEQKINGELVPGIGELLELVDWNNLFNGISTRRFHGDLHFSNVFWTKEGYKLIDWRPDFGGSTEYGDVYYDLAKINEGLLVSYDVIKSNNYSIDFDGHNVKFDISRSHRLVECWQQYKKLAEVKYDWKKIETITALIFMNIATLHHYPYSLFLYFFGKKLLYEVVK